MWRISEEVSWTVKSSYFEKGTVQWIVCIEKKSVCLKYANVVLLLYDALNLIDNLTEVLSSWYLLPRGRSVACPGPLLWPPSPARLCLRGGSDRCRFLQRCLQFSDLNDARMTTILAAFLVPGRWPLPWGHRVSRAGAPCPLPFLVSHLLE